jgi:hypothetical protein
MQRSPQRLAEIVILPSIFFNSVFILELKIAPLKHDALPFTRAEERCFCF